MYRNLSWIHLLVRLTRSQGAIEFPAVQSVAGHGHEPVGLDTALAKELEHTASLGRSRAQLMELCFARRSSNRGLRP